MASISKIKRKKGDTYRISVSLGYDKNGKQIKETTTYVPDYSLSKVKQEKALKKFVAEFEEKALNRQLFAGEKLRFDDYCDIWLEEQQERLAPSTYNFYKKFIEEMLAPKLGYMKMADIKVMHIKDFIKNVKGYNGQKLKPATIKKYLAIIKSIFKTAWQDEVIETNPAERVKAPRQEVNQKVKCFDIEQAQTFLALLGQKLEYTYQGHTRKQMNGMEYHVSIICKIIQYLHSFVYSLVLLYLEG